MSQHSFGDYIKKIGVGAILLVAVLLTPAVSQAAVLTWDPAMDGLGNGGTGPWDVTTPLLNWYDPTIVPWTADVAWTAGSDAVFGGMGGAVAVDLAGVNAQSLTFNVDGYSLSGGTITLSGTPVITVTNQSDTATILDVIDNALGLSKAGAGTLVLSGANTYNGLTTIGAGVLKVGNAGALGNAFGNITFTGGTLQFSDVNQVDYSARIVNSTSAIAIDNNGQTVIFASPLAASNIGGLSKTGGGVLILSGANTYSGATTINNGMLKFTKANAMSATSAITVGSADIPGPPVIPGTSATLAVNVGGAGEITEIGVGAGTLAGLLAGIGGQVGSTVTWTNGAIGIDTSNAPGPGFTVAYANNFVGGAVGSEIGLVKLGTGTLQLSGGGTWTKGGAAGFPLIARQGTLLLTGATPYTVNGEAVVGGDYLGGIPGYNAAMVVDHSTLNVNGWLSVGRGNNATSDLTLTSATVTAQNMSAGAQWNGSTPHGTITLNDSSLNAGGTFKLGESSGSNFNMLMNGASSISLNGDVGIGISGTGTVTMTSPSSMSNWGAAPWVPFNIGSDASGLGSITMGSDLTDTPAIHSQITACGDFRVGNFGTGTYDLLGNLVQPGGTLNMSGYAAISAGGTWGWGTWFDIAREVGSTGKVVMSGHSSIHNTSDINVGNSGTGSLTMGSLATPGNASVSASGDITLGRCGQGGTAGIGTVTMYGGTMTAGGAIQLEGGTSSFTQTGGTISAKCISLGNNSGANVLYDISAGSLTATGDTSWIGRSGDGTLNIHGTASVSTAWIALGGIWWSGSENVGNATITIADTATLTVVNNGINSTGTGTKTINLNGGTLNVRYIGTWGGGPTNLNLNGGLLQANGSDNLIGWINSVNVLNTTGSGGAYIDTNTFDCSTNTALVDGDGLGGGLTKLGLGTLTLNGVNTYTGLTTVNAGTLKLTGSVAGNCLVTEDLVKGTVGTMVVTGTGSVAGAITVNGTGATFVHNSSAVLPSLTLTKGTLDGTGTLTTVNVADLAANVVTNGGGIGTGTGALTITNLTFLGAATMNLNPASQVVPALITTNLVTSGKQVTINPSAPIWQGGINSLISYVNPNYCPGGNPDFVLGAVTGLSARQLAAPAPTLDYNTPGIIALQVNGYNPTWTGAIAVGNPGYGEWTTNLLNNPKNWVLNDPGATTTDFWAGDIVTFDDSAAVAGGTTNVVISDANVAPMKVIFNNVGAVYTISSAPLHDYGIVDHSPTTMVIQGGGVVTLASTNTYSGGTTITSGTLNIENASAIGTGALTIGPLPVGATITLDNTSATVTGLSTNNPQNWNSSFTFAGSAGSHDLNMGNGTVTLGASPTVTVADHTLTVGVIAPAGHGLTKAGAGTLAWVGTTPTVGAVAATSLSGLTVSGTMNQASGTATVYGTMTIGDLSIAGAIYNLSGGKIVKNATAGGQNLVLGNGLNTVGALNLSNNAVLEIQNEEFDIGDRINRYDGSDLTGGTGTVTMTDTSKITVSGTDFNKNFYIGGHNGTGIGTLEMHLNASITINRGEVSIGGSDVWWNGATAPGAVHGTVTMYDQASITKTSGDDFELALGDSGNADVTLNQSANITTGGALKMGDTSGTTGHSQLTLNNSSWIKVNGEVWLGQNTLSADHVINVNGTSTITSESWFCVGRGTGTGVLNVNGGTVKKEGTNSDGSPNGNFILGSDRGNGTVYLESGSILNNAQVILGENSGAVANFHLDGGLVQATALAINGTGVYASNMYYNGGTLQATADSTNFVNAGVMQYVQAKGAVIDSNTHAITINTAFTEDYLTPSPGGGLTKIGAGTLTLGGWNSYTGYTTVTNGILQAAITGSLPNYGIAGNVKVSTGATIAVNAGGVSDWLASEVNTLDTNAAYSGGSYIGFDTTNATPSFTYSYAVANPLSGTKGLKKLGTNTLVLDATNTYSGNTVINNGTLELASTGQIATASAISTAATTAIFQVDGTHTVGNISGVGTTNLLAGSSLTATSVVQGTVTLGIGARLTIAPIPGGPTAGAGSLSAVPEPSTWAMLMLAAMGLGMYWRRSR